MPLNLQMLINNELLDELAKCFNNKTDAGLLLAAINFPAAYRPNFERSASSMDFWLKVCEQIESGRIQGGFEPLLQAAAKRLPGNPLLAPFARAAPPAPGPAARGQPPGGTAPYPQSVVDSYDVFISYSSKDRAGVREIVNAMRQRSVRPWMDEWDLPLGRPFVQELEHILSNIKVVVAFLGTNGLGPWQRAEIEIILERALRNQCLLIPVLLPGTEPSDLPPFLRRLNCIGIKNGQDVEAIEKLVTAILGQRR